MVKNLKYVYTAMKQNLKSIILINLISLLPEVILSVFWTHLIRTIVSNFTLKRMLRITVFIAWWF